MTSQTPAEVQQNRLAARKRFFSVFPYVILPMFLAAVDQTIVVTALPAIAGELGEVQQISWVVITYLVAATIAAPVYGRLGDLIGLKPMALVGLALLVGASLVCALSENMTTLLAGRIVQGIGGGGLMTTCHAILGAALGPRERARYQGFVAAVAVSASVSGPLLGSFLTETFGWRAVFFANVPLGLTAALFALRLPWHRKPREPFRFDYIGLTLFAIFISSVLVALNLIQRLDIAAVPVALALLLLGALAIWLLIRQERRATTPLLPITMFSNPNIWRADALTACHGAMLVSFLTFLPIFLRVARGASATEIALVLIFIPLGIGSVSLITGRLVGHTGRTTIFPAFGLLLAFCAQIYLAFFAAEISMQHLTAVIFVNSLAMGTVMGVVQVIVMTAAGPQMLGSATASVQFSRSLGAALGTALTGMVLFAGLAASSPDAARLFGELLQQNAGALDGLGEAARQSVRNEILWAFRGAFFTIAGFCAVAIALSWSIPMKRI